MDDNLSYVLVQLAIRLPGLAVLIAGVVLAAFARGRLPAGARNLLLGGLASLLLLTLVTTVWSVTLPWVLNDDRSWGVALAGVLDVAYVLLFPVGLGLLIAAAFAGRRTGSAPGPVVPSTPAAWGEPQADAHRSPVDKS